MSLQLTVAAATAVERVGRFADIDLTRYLSASSRNWQCQQCTFK